MTKDGVREKVSRDLRRLWDDALCEPIPSDWKELLDKLK